MDFGKMLTAMVTPFDSDLQIDYPRTSLLIEHLLANGSDALVIHGTTGEAPTLSENEKSTFLSYVVDAIDGRIPVIAGTGSNDTEETIRLSHEAAACGADALMLAVPFYNKPSQKGIYRHFEKIAASTDLPIMIYNVPGRTAVNIDAATVIALSAIDNIISVKEASGDLSQAADIIEATPDDFTVYSGDDPMTLPMLAIGADGVVSVASHIIGEEIKEMIEAYLQGEIMRAAMLHRELLPVMRALFAAPSPAPVKKALDSVGVPVGDVRLPLISLTPEENLALMEATKPYTHS